MADRVVLIVLMLLGLAIGFSGGLEQATLGRAVYLIWEAAGKAEAKPLASELGEAQQALDVSWTLTKTSTYLGVAVVLVASFGLYRREKRPPNDRPE